MRKLIDRTPKANHAIRDSFLKLPDALTPKQTRAVANIRKLLRYEVKDASTI